MGDVSRSSHSDGEEEPMSRTSRLPSTRRAPLAATVTLLALTFGAARPTSGEGLGVDGVRERARVLGTYVSANEPGPLWTAFDQSMRLAMGDSTRFAETLSAIHADVGAMIEIIDEDVEETQGTWVYLARCRFEKSPAPLQLIIAFTPDGSVAGLRVRPQAQAFPSTTLDHAQSTTLRLPFRGEWTVYWGGRTLEENYHAVSKTQRFAIDFVIIENGTTHRGPGDEIEDYFAYGRELLAPADGRVVTVIDGLPDQPIGSSDPENPYGNVVVLDHGAGEYSVLAHLKPGSVRVGAGDEVTAGEVVGLCGNSGNTSEPHLHFQLQNGPDLMDSEGLPARFTHAEVDGDPRDSVELVKGQTVRAIRGE
jgi:murein DD-endopeptidase MepM/ murein hydrolase activator NlpD